MEHWRIADAEAALPRVREMLVECRAILAEMRSRDHVLHHDEAQRRFHDALDRFADDGIQVRDLDAGIVDFLTRRGDETVCLCWQEGETGITHWHPLDTGMAGRRPLPDLAVLRAAELA